MRPAGIVLVTDPAFPDDAIVAAIHASASSVPPGTVSVQLRDKRRDPSSLRAFAVRLRSVTRACGASLVLNGSAALARSVGADGVHFGAGAGSVAEARALFGREGFISVAAHSDDAVTAAVAEGADAVLVSPIFATPGKGPARGPAALQAARAIAGGKLRVYALGGVDIHNVASCVEAGADGVAVVRAWLASHNPAEVSRAFHAALRPLPTDDGRARTIDTLA